MFGTEPGGFFKVMVHRDKDEFYKAIQKEAEDRGTTLLSVCRSRGISYNTFSRWKQRHPASFGKEPSDKGPEEPTEVIHLRPEGEKETDNDRMYRSAEQRKDGERESGDVEITLTISCPDLRKLERIMEAIANV
jgi:hypothetical protein